MARVPPAPVVRYGEHPDQLANLHLPAGTPPFPVVALLHGGFWRARWDRTLLTPVAVDLARRGYAAWNVEFRRVGQPGGDWPGSLEDVQIALDALGAIAEVDAHHVVLLGHSAGGHLALLAARGRADIAAVVAIAAVTDLSQARELDAAAVDELVGGTREQHTSASPLSQLPLDVPQMLVHGENDAVVPISMSVAYVEAARSAGDEVELVRVPGADHFDVIDPTHAAWRVVRERIARALG